MNHGYHGDIFCTTATPDSPDGTVVVLADFPDTNTYEAVMEWMNRRGHAALHPRYPGSMQSHGGFLRDHPGEEIAGVIDAVAEPPVVALGVGFGSLVALSTAARADISGVIAYDPWWDVDLLSDPEAYFDEAFDTHHYLYRDQRDSLPVSLRHYADLYPHGYVDGLNTPVQAFIPGEPSVPRGATEEMRDLIDVRVVDHNAVSVSQCLMQHMDRVYTFLDEVMV